MAEPPWGADLSSGPQIARRGMFATDASVHGESEIVLNEGQGFGLFLRNASAQFFHEFIAVVVIDAPDVVTGGSVATSYAF